MTIAAPLLTPYDPTFETIEGLAPDGGPLDAGAPETLLGTDPKGRDLFSRIIYGGRVTFVAALAAVGSPPWSG